MLQLFKNQFINSFMQPIDDLNYGFFEDVTLHPLRNIADLSIITSDDYFVFGHGHKFKGIKKVYENEKLPFYLLHEETFDIAKRVFKNLFGHEPDQVKVYHNDEKTWNAFIVGSKALTKDEGTQYTNSPFTFEEAGSFTHFPLIGGINNYDLDRNPAFFYLIATPFKKAQGSLLTLDNFRFHREDDKKIFFSQSREHALSDTIISISRQFEEAAARFDTLLKSIAHHSIPSEAFAPVVLDLYDRNRNPESIRNDERLRSRVKRLFNDAKINHRRYPETSWTEFIHFITRYNQFDLNRGLPLESVEELFSKKEAYRK